MTAPGHDGHPVWRVLTALAAVLPASLFLTADLPRGWLFVCAVAALVGALPLRWAPPVAFAIIGHVIYLAGCSSAWSLWAAGAALVALLAMVAVQPNHRQRILLLVVAVLVPLAVVAWILARSTWVDEATRAVAVIGALALAGTAVLAILRLGNAPSTYRRSVHFAVAALALVAAVQPERPVAKTALPDWRAQLLSVLPPGAGETSGPQRRLLLGQLSDLRAAGVEEADHAWVALAVLENVDPESLRRICFRGNRHGELGSAWRQFVETGRIACRALEGPPDHGAELLASVGEDTALPTKLLAALLRLRANLHVEMNDPSRALALYSRASNAGDRFALRDAARLAIDENLPAAPELTATPDPLIQMWLRPNDNEPAFWSAWNQALDFSSLQPLSRIGVRTSGTRKETVKIAHNRERGYRAITSKTRPRSAFRAELPLPPGRRLPGEVILSMRNEYGFRLTYVAEDGRSVAFSCVPRAANSQQILVSLPESACSRGWSEVVVRPATHLDGRLVSSSLEGIFNLEELRIVPPVE